MATTRGSAAAGGSVRSSYSVEEDASGRAARHAAHARTSPGRLVLRNLLHGRPQYALLSLSDLGRAILTNKYDAFTTDLAYANQPSGRLGPIGRLIDRIVLGVDLHADLRDRLRIVTAELVRAVEERRAAGADPVRLLTVPSGLCRDVIAAVGELRGTDPAVAEHLELWAVDLDERGDVIPEAERRCGDAGPGVHFCRADALDEAAMRATLGAGRRFDVINCIGLTPWLSAADVGRLLRFISRDLLAPRGLLLLDNFAPHSTSHTGPHLEIVTAYHDPAVLAGAFRGTGLEVVRERITARTVNTVYVLRASPAQGVGLASEVGAGAHHAGSAVRQDRAHAAGQPGPLRP